MAYDIGPKIGIEGEAEFRAAIQNVNQQVKTLTSEMEEMVSSFTDGDDAEEQLAKQTEILNKQIKAQEEKVKLLNRGVNESAQVYGEAGTQTLQWKEVLNKAKTELNRMNDSLKDAENGVEDFGDAAADSEAGLGDLIKGLSDLKNMVLGGAIVNGLKEMVGSVLELEESTREYRRTMDSLNATIYTMEYDAEEMAAAYDRLYGVLGDSQTAATTLSNLMAVRTSEENIIELIDLATGAWSKYGDSIPIDGLAEAINETVRAGQVTGVFADVLNWGSSEGETFGVMLKENIEFTELSKKELEKLTEAQRAEYEATKEQYDAIEKYNEGVLEAKSAEDYFNIALQNTQTEQERLALIMEAMSNGELDTQAKKWRELNEDVIAANDAQNRMEESMARLGETVAPLANAIRDFGADAIDWLVDKIERVIPVLEGMAEAARIAWDAITGGEKRDVYTTGQYGSRSVDGSHAAGLAYVPFDGYRAELHEGEMVIPASMAARMRSSANSAFTTMAEGMVNGMQTAVAGMGGGSYSFTLVMPDNTVLARYQLPALIDVANANGTPILNPVNA